jgi:hypothetical protein
LVASDPEGPDALTHGSTRQPRCPHRHAQIRRAAFIDNRDPTALWELAINSDGSQRELKRRLLTGLSRGSLSDPEGLTRIDANGAIDLMVASSLSVWNPESGQAVANQGLVHVRYRPKGELVADAMPGFREWLLTQHPALAPVAELDPDHSGLNIEGLAWDPARKVALRRPFPHHRWSDIGVAGPSGEHRRPLTTAALEARPVLEIDKPSMQPAQGIRDLTYDIERQDFLVVLGRSISGATAPFQLCTWDGTSTTVTVLDVKFNQSMKPEGVTVFHADGARRILIVDDARGYATFSAADAGD